MAKEESRKLFYIYFVEHGLTAKEAAQKANVTETTASRWVDKYKMKAERDARIFGTNQRIENVRGVLGALAEETMELTRQLREANEQNDRGAAKDIRMSLASLSDQAAKWNKTLANIEGKERITLSVYLHVMEDLFKAMYAKHPAIYQQLISFQEEVIHTKAAELA
ncbi:MAG: DUF1804 family protein [Gammaproteobacteria bacterium]|nr:DUF1804 family protein [Gammaproteobacteria bacterium]